MKKNISLFATFLMTSSLFAAPANYSVKDVPGLITQTYILAIVCAVIFIGLAVLISNSINFEAGPNPKDPSKRRMWFWIFAVSAPIIFYLYNFMMVIPSVRKGPASETFSIHPPIATAMVLLIFIISGFALSKMFKRGKLGSWFPTKEK